MTGHYRRRPALKGDEHQPGGSNIDQPLDQREANPKINMTVNTLPMPAPAPAPPPPKSKSKCDADYITYAIVTALNLFFFCVGLRMIIILPRGELSPPIFHLHSLSISVSRIPPFNVTSSQVNNNTVIIRWNVSFDVRNPYKYQKTIHDQAINVSIFYKKVNLSTAVLSPFYQYELGEDQRSLEKAALLVANDDILAGDWSKNGAIVNFTVSIDDAVILISPPYTYFPINLVSRFTCEDVTTIFSSDNTTTTIGRSMLSNHSKQCKIQYSNQVFKFSSIWYRPSFRSMSN